ncbi:MAG: nucleotidyltransferase family protein [Blautia sp.]
MVKIAGIIAEYNPLHRGHQFHIERLAASPRQTM